MKRETLTDLLSIAIHASMEAGRAVLEVYDSGDPETDLKEDQSPLTLADLRSHTVISTIIKESGFPVLSEEGAQRPYDERKRWSSFWMIDPLDGTKEFIKRNGEFTVNIAFITNNQPVLGVVNLPVLKRLYFAVKGEGAYRIDRIGRVDGEHLRHALDARSVRLPDKKKGKKTRVIASRSHLSPETEDFIKQLEQQKEPVELVSAGSSLKLCLVAEGAADLYPRLGPTMEWDIAAGHIIITESGGTITKVDGALLEFNKPDLLNPWFVAKSKFYQTEQRR